MWDSARSQWRALKTLEPIVANSLDSGVSPQQVLGAINRTQQGRTAMARGRGGEMGELARIGQQMKPPRSSGTTENSIASDGNNFWSWPLLGAKSIGGLALNRGLLSNPRAAELLMRSGGAGQGLQRVAPYAQRAGLLGINPAEDWASQYWPNDPNE